VKPFHWLAVVAIWGMMLVGCAEQNATTEVTGLISYKGRPATHGVINFVAPGQRPLGGAINADGTYQALVPPGEYQVRIDAPPRIPEGAKEGEPIKNLEPRLIPEKFADFKSSGLTATITGESSQKLDFALE
jgi:hypothetical protein